MDNSCLRHLFLVLLLLLSSSCRRGPTAGDHVDRTMAALEIYLFKGAAEAETAMLDLEKFTLECQEQGVDDIDYDGHLAAVYSRLYRVQTVLGKMDHASTNFNLASNYWRVHYKNRWGSIPTPEEMRIQIDGTDRYFGTPVWKK